jgi:hypothetical protein
LPLALWLTGKSFGLQLQDSMSQYYHADYKYQAQAQKFDARDMTALEHANTIGAPLTVEEAAFSHAVFRPGSGSMRNWFVGSLFMVGILLIAYRGYDMVEETLLDVAGAAAIGVALFPMPWGTDRSVVDLALAKILRGVFSSSKMPSFHYLCAGTLFLCLAGVCFYACYRSYKDSLLPQYKSYLAGYVICGMAMLSIPFVDGSLDHMPDLRTYKVFVIEAIGVWAFAGYWCIKSFEIDEHHHIQETGLEGWRPSYIAPIAGVLSVLVIALAAGAMWAGTEKPAVEEIHVQPSASPARV